MNAKAFAHQKRTRRQWLAFVRMCRYGINNFSRNAWLSLAATAIMTITLVIVFISFASRTILIDSAAQIRDKIDMSIYINYNASDESVATIQRELEQLKSVKSVTYTNPEDARQSIIEKNKQDTDILEAITEAKERSPGEFNIKLVNVDDTRELESFASSNETLKKNSSDRYPPSFQGERREAIKTITGAVQFAETAGIGATVLFAVISSLIVFNTIRMAIYNRKEEIQMMKLIGADRSFIRGPFVVEAMMYGFIAALFATAIGVLTLVTVEPVLTNQEIVVQPTLELITLYIGVIVLGMILIGALIGVISSLLATRRYLKI